MSKAKTPTRAYRGSPQRPTSRLTTTDIPLREHAEAALSSYFERLSGQQPAGLYALVLREVEQPLFKAVMHYTEGNQSKAAQILGLNRGTLRRKLEDYGLAD